jgi:multidrug transporter EmrE-like cation transporter
MKTILLIFVVSATTVISQLILKKGVTGFASAPASPIHLATMALTSPYVLLSLALQGISFLLWVLVLSKSNLGYAFGFSGAFFYLILPLLSWWLYGERLSPIQWGGLMLISLGVLCLQVRGS